MAELVVFGTVSRFIIRKNRSELQTRLGTAGAQIVCRRRFEAAMVVIRSEAAKRSSYALPAGKEPRKRRALRSSGVYVKLKTEHRKPITGLALVCASGWCLKFFFRKLHHVAG
jgi:hypothetical protein